MRLDLVRALSMTPVKRRPSSFSSESEPSGLFSSLDYETPERSKGAAVW